MPESKLDLNFDTYDLPELKLEHRLVLGEETADESYTIPFIKVTPEDRAKSKTNRTEFFRAILKRIYEENKKVGTGDGQYSHRIPYKVHASGNIWSPIGEYVDDSDIFVFLGRLENNTMADGREFLKNDVVEIMLYYDEIVTLHSNYIKNVDENGKDLCREVYEQAMTNRDNIVNYPELIHKITEKVIGKAFWATDENLDFKVFLNNFKEAMDQLNKIDISTSIECLEHKKRFLISCMNIFNNRYNTLNLRRLCPDSFWIKLFSKYGKFMKDNGIQPYYVQ